MAHLWTVGGAMQILAMHMQMYPLGALEIMHNLKQGDLIRLFLAAQLNSSMLIKIYIHYKGTGNPKRLSE